MQQPILVLNTCPNQETAQQIAEHLVQHRLAACVNIVPGLLSVYHWQGKVETDKELLLIIKTQAGRYTEVETAIRQLHPYELPEVVAVPIDQGLPDYLDWINQTVSK